MSAQNNYLDERKYSVAEAARELGVEPRTVRRYILAGRLKALRYTSRKQVVPKSSLEDFFHSAHERAIEHQLSLFT